MQYQKTLNFDAATDSQKEQLRVSTSTSLPPPPLVRPDRQIVYPDATTHFDWPNASELHDRDTLTVDRVVDDIDGPAHRFVIKRGDTVEAYIGNNRFHVGEVIGISHARGEVRVAWDDTLTRGGWYKVGAIYPAPEPEPQVPEPYTLDEFKELLRLRGRHQTFAVYRQHFERVLASQDTIVSELKSSHNVRELMKIAQHLGVWHYKNSTKTKNAEAIYQKVLGHFLLDGTVSFSMGETYQDALVKKVRDVTEDKWNAHYADVEAKHAEQLKAIEDPKDLSDFRLFLQAKGEAGELVPVD